jgi:CRP-like cAMP-binding protein
MHYATNTTAASKAAAAMPFDHDAKSVAAPAISIIGAQQNELLKALSRDELMSLFADLELVQLPAGKHLFDVGGKMDYGYFPTNAIISLQYATEDGGSTEIAMVGAEGVVGVSMYVGEQAVFSAVVQSGGYAYRVKSAPLRAAFFAGGALSQQLMRHTSALFAQVAQTVAGARHGSIEQRLCRWLLERLDRSPSNELKVTQEMIANMLSVRRESVTGAAGRLQDEGSIEYRRGTVVILNRAALEARAGGCYQAPRSLSSRA